MEMIFIYIYLFMHDISEKPLSTFSDRTQKVRRSIARLRTIDIPSLDQPRRVESVHAAEIGVAEL